MDRFKCDAAMDMTRKLPKGAITAGELQKQLWSDPEWVAAKKAKDAERAAHSRYLDELEAGLEQELRDAGIEARSYRHIIDKPKNYQLGIPILIRHMRMDKYTDVQRNFMAQAIAMKDANPYWHELLEIFLSVVGKKENTGFEQGLAVVLAASFRAPQFDILLSLCENQEYGAPRALLAQGLKKSKDPRAEIALMKFCSDPYLGKEMTKWMKRREKRRNLEGRNDVGSFN
jgi:hypothetical protein